MRVARSILIILSVLLSVSTAAGQDKTTDATKEKAQEYFQRAEVLIEAGEYTKAAQAFWLAYEISPHPSVLANIALCYDNAGKIPKAVEIYRQYLEEVGDSEDTTDLRKRLKVLENYVGEIAIDCAVPHCRIKVNGVDRGEAPVKVIVKPGKHQVEAFSRDNASMSVEVVIKSGKTSGLTMHPLDPDKADIGTQIDEKPSGGGYLSVPFWIATGMTAIAGGATIYFGVRTLDYHDKYENSGHTDEDALDSGLRSKLLTNAMIGITAASAVVAFGFALNDLWLSNDEKQVVEEDLFVLTPGPGLGLGVAKTF